MYSYNTARLNEFGLDRLRFDLGDTQVDGGAKTAALADEEYAALIDQAQSEGYGFDRAFYLALVAIDARFSMSVDVKTDGVDIGLSQRAQRWHQMRLNYEAGRRFPLPLGAYCANASPPAHMFYIGMHDNPRALERP